MFINKFWNITYNLFRKRLFIEVQTGFYCILRIISYTKNVPYGDVLASTGVWKI